MLVRVQPGEVSTEKSSIPHSVAVIGGGAAGFFAAIKCAEENPSCRVTLYEKGAHILTKVRVSGGGRCNVTHSCFSPKELIKNYPRGGQALLGPFHKFQPSDTIKWFERRGVLLKTESDGRLFPTTDASITIVNALRDAANASSVKVRTHAGLSSIVSEKPRRFRLLFSGGGEEDVCQRLLLATGSSPQGYDWAASLGHTIESPVPSLFTFTIPDERLKGLAGISVEKASIKIVGTKLEQSGPLLITHWGMSGPAVLKLSAWGARTLHDADYHSQIQVNWTGQPAFRTEEKLRDFKKTHPRKTVSSHPLFEIPQRLWERLASSSQIGDDKTWADISNAHIASLIKALTANIYILRGKSTFKEEFVTCGGVSLDEVDFRTMESRLVPGLYFAGEILDIDGVTGGFNFQNAWTTGWIAGRAMAQSSVDPEARG